MNIRRLLALFLWCFAASATVFGQEGENFVVERRMTGTGEGEYTDVVTYYDGFGRRSAVVGRGASPSGGDIAVLTEYDSSGREWREWLPVPLPGGAVPSPRAVSAEAPAFYGDSSPYAETHYEPSPLGRVSGRTGPGREWREAGRRTEVGYRLSRESGELSCARFEVGADGSLRRSGVYPGGALHVTETSDEDGNTVLLFKGSGDRVVLSRSLLSSSQFADTHYVYDSYGDLRYVVPPELSSLISGTDGEWDTNDDDIWDYAYVYRYDGCGRCVYRKLPGCEPMLTGYDAGGKPVLEQDGNQRERGEWTLRLFDRLRREVVRAVVKAANADMFAGSVLRTEYTGNLSAGLGGYEADIALPEVVSLQSVSYYDSHAFIGMEDSGDRDRYLSSPVAGYGDVYPNHTGRLTGERTYLQDGSGESLLSAYYYDMDGNVVESRSSNHVGGMESVHALYDLAGKPLKSRLVHTDGEGAETIAERTYGYDHAGRLTVVTHRIGGGETRVLLKNSYDWVGRLAAAEMNGGSYRTGYSYNVRGWLTEIASPLMEQTLNYTEHSLRRKPYMNGNINSVTTKNNLINPVTGQVTGSGKATVIYMYDKLNRLTSSTYEPEGRPTNPAACNTAYNYDLNGNITMLSRQGVNQRLDDDGEAVYAGYGFTDQITATYDGNRLVKAKDYAGEVVYGDAFDFRDGADEDEWTSPGK